MVPPKTSISDYVGMIKGRTAISVFIKLKSKPYWGNRFWARGYCVDIVGLDSDMIRKYVKISTTNRKTDRTVRPVRQLKTWGQLPLLPQRARQTYPFQDYPKAEPSGPGFLTILVWCRVIR